MNDQLLMEIEELKKIIQEQNKTINELKEDMIKSESTPPEWFIKEGYARDLEYLPNSLIKRPNDFWKSVALAVQVLKKNGYVRGFR
jgi:hypothetical protein